MRKDNHVAYREEFNRIAPRIWKYFGLDKEGIRTAKAAFRIEMGTTIKCYRAINNTLPESQ